MRASLSPLIGIGLGLVALAACDSQSAPPPGEKGPGRPVTPPPLQEWVGEPGNVPRGPSSDGLQAQRLPLDAWGPAITQLAPDQAGFEPGQWVVQDGSIHQVSFFPATRLSSRRLQVTLPASYRYEVSGWVTRARGVDPVRDTGVYASIPYMRDSRHWIIVSLAPGLLEAWICDGQNPGQTWPASQRLWSEPIHPPRVTGQASTLTCDVDFRTTSLVIHLDGQVRARVTNPFLAAEPNVAVGLACNGSHVRFAPPGLWSLGAGITPERGETVPRPIASPSPTLPVVSTPVPVRPDPLVSPVSATGTPRSTP